MIPSRRMIHTVFEQLVMVKLEGDLQVSSGPECSVTLAVIGDGVAGNVRDLFVTPHVSKWQKEGHHKDTSVVRCTFVTCAVAASHVGLVIIPPGRQALTFHGLENTYVSFRGAVREGSDEKHESCGLREVGCAVDGEF